MKKTILSLMALVSLGAFAQTGYYVAPGTGSGNPGGLNGDAEYPPGGGLPTGWTTLITGPQNEMWSASQNMPFAFKFNDQDVTSYKVAANGVVTFDVATTITPSAVNGDLPNAGIPNQSVCVWGVGATATGDYVVSKTFGTAGKRQHWIQYNSCSEANIGTGWIYASIVLEEGTNNIYIVDQRYNGTAASKISMGVQIDGSTAIKVSGTPAYGMKAVNDPTTADNVFYSFIPGSQPADEAGITSLNLAKYLNLNNGPYDISMGIINGGSSAITSLDVEYTIDGGAAVSGKITGLNIASGATGTAVHPTKWSGATVGSHTVAVKIVKVNGADDTKVGNNNATQAVMVFDKAVDRKILNEVFTSSTCGPCTAGNINYNNVIANKTKHSTIKYQVYWPGTGDPYCTQEVRDRTTYYGINSVPRMEVDGGWDGNAGSFSTGLYDDFQAKPAFVEITGSVSLTWKNTVTLDVTLNPLLDFSSNNLKLHAVIVEGITYANKKTNGETKFEEVMKKMMTGSVGQVLTPLKKDTKVTKKIAYTFNGGYRLPTDGSAAQHINHLSENSVETWNDLAVVVFVQDATTKEVLQSETFPIALVGTEAVEQNLNLYPNPANNVFVVEAKEMGNAAVVVTDMQGKVVFNGNMNAGALSMNVADWSNGVYMVSVNGNSKNLNSKIVVRH
ncbi:MAG: T9SS type A sorting domain-containing protein [Bacteroidia bacterium]